MNMLTDLVDHVIGVDPDRDRITAAIIDSRTQGELARAEFAANPSGYRALIDWADDYSTAEGRVWSIEGTGSYGAGLTATLGGAGEWVVEFDRPATRAARDGAKSDGLDAVRAARELLGREKWAQPRARGTREAMRVLLVARNGAQRSRVAAINQIKGLLVTAPTRLREELRGLTTPQLVKRCAAFRAVGHDEVAVTKTSMRILARRIRSLDTEIKDIDKQLKGLVVQVAPQLLDEYGVGPVCAAQVYVSWSHRGRCRNEASFARLAGVAPVEATSGQTQNRHRLNRGGDRKLNRALHTIVTVRIRYQPETRDYIAAAIKRGKTKRDATRALKRYVGRHLYRLLENPPQPLAAL
jgi:transposase